MLADTSRAAVVTVLGGSLFLAACGHPAPPTPPTPPPVTMSFCGGNPQASPDVVLVVCNTNDITARNLTWAAWGKPTSTATGIALVDLCAYEDCHTGSYGTVPIRLIVSKIVGCAGQARAYSRLRYVFPDGTPWPGIPANMNTSGYMAGPGRDLPPANQTVSLAC